MWPFRKRQPKAKQRSARIPVMPEPEPEFYDFGFRSWLTGKAPETTIALLERHEPTIRLAMLLQVNVAIHQRTGRTLWAPPEDHRAPATNGWMLVFCDKE